MEQQGLNVSTFIFLFIITIFVSCNSTRKIGKEHNYSIEKHKSSRRSITINAFDSEVPNDVLPKCLIIINKLYFGDTNFFRPAIGKHSIEVSHIGKESISIKDIMVRQNDSIIINTYLKDSRIPIE
ncbi:hypothetical protein [Tenacibaculum agarivorans]|uniref:hypothetical protein n=1 Tax=Tenacibaculum agarivorans TaxID=1908389 RepID=UPI00094B87CA|nr:hypothetical protein [Tenacibaculum agarivorans]